MNREEQIEAHQEIQEYLQRNQLHGLLSHLMQQLILEKPKNVLDFLIGKLEAPEKFTLFVVGPPGLSINATISKALATGDRSFELFNCGEEITRAFGSLKQADQGRFNSCLLVEEQAIEAIIGKIEGYAKTEKNYIIEGFPKNLRQALILQKKGIYAKNVLVINIDDKGLSQILRKKLAQLNPKLTSDQLAPLVEAARMQHRIHINQIKNFYKQYLEIDLSQRREEPYVIAELNKAFSIKTIQAVPRVSSQVVIVGAPFSGRTTLGKKIAAHYNFVYISTSFLIAEEIRKDTIHGRKIRSQFTSNELIDDFLIEKLIEERIAKKDCCMQGFVIEGYPKNPQQFDNIRNMKLSPTLIVAIDTPKTLSASRNKADPAHFQTRYKNWSALSAHLRASKERIFWVDSALSIGNLYEEVIHEFEKQFT